MEYRGVEFTIVQAVQRQKWKWTVTIPDIGYRTGLADDKSAAIRARRSLT